MGSLRVSMTILQKEKVMFPVYFMTFFLTGATHHMIWCLDGLRQSRKVAAETNAGTSALPFQLFKPDSDRMKQLCLYVCSTADDECLYGVKIGCECTGGIVTAIVPICPVLRPLGPESRFGMEVYLQAYRIHFLTYAHGIICGRAAEPL